MSRPISITNSNNSENLASPSDSLGRSAGALRIVENICSSPVYSNRICSISKPEKLPETPDFHIGSFINQGGKVIGQNAKYAFGTPPFCQCASPGGNIGTWTNSGNQAYVSNYSNQSVISEVPSQTAFFHHSAPNVVDVFQPPIVPMTMAPILTTQYREHMNNVGDDLLSKYRSNPSAMKSLKLSDIRGNLLKFAKDQVGSRFIQQKLESSDSTEKDAIFDEVIQNATELVDDIFGNYVVQKFFEFGEQKHWTKLIDAIIDKVPEHALQMYACRVLQKALEKVNEPLQITILNKVKGIILDCMKDQNGNHVIQKAVEKVSPHHIQFIIDNLLAEENTVHQMSIDPYGCRVVQRCLEHCDPHQTRPIIDRLHERFDEISVNQYGNYVIQHVIEHGSEKDRVIIVEKISNNLLKYSTHKYSSNVIEKCLKLGSIQHKSSIVDAACCQVEREPPIIVQMMKDQYANYVVQRMFDEVNADQRKELTSTIRPHIPILRQFQHGKHILAKLDKHFPRNGEW